MRPRLLAIRTKLNCHANETGFCCTAAAHKAVLLTIRRPPWQQQPGLARRHERAGLAPRPGTAAHRRRTRAAPRAPARPDRRAPAEYHAHTDPTRTAPRWGRRTRPALSTGAAIWTRHRRRAASHTPPTVMRCASAGAGAPADRRARPAAPLAHVCASPPAPDPPDATTASGRRVARVRSGLTKLGSAARRPHKRRS